MASDISLQKKYRPEIDGLRAIAVLAVIINHFNPNLLPGGFLGVDIFFVISGYVITQSILSTKSKNFWEFISFFYEKRIKRLLPALMIYILVGSILICLFKEDPSEQIQTGLLSLFGLSNIDLFRKSTDYFAESTSLNPFAHTWSLGVEAQFYFIYPILIWLIKLKSKTQKINRTLFAVIISLSLISIILYIQIYYQNSMAAYFLMPTRFWEIAVGCLFFLKIRKKTYLNINLSTYILSGIITCFFLPISAIPFSNFLIVLLTLFLLASAKEETKIYSFLTNKYIIRVGLLSYSLYLWHWGILSISKLTIGVHWWTIPIQFLLIFCCALLSYEFIEKPFRRDGSFFSKWSSFISLTLFSSAIFSLYLPFKEKLYLGNTSLNNIESWPNINNLVDSSCIEKEDQNTKKNSICIYQNKNNVRTMFFMGDSHTLTLLEGALDISKTTFSNLDYVELIFPPEEIFLKEIKKEDIMILTIRYPYYFIKNWYETYPDYMGMEDEYFNIWVDKLERIIQIAANKNIKIILSTPTPEFKDAREKKCNGQVDQWFNRLSKKNCSISIAYFNSINGKYFKINKKLKQLSSNYDNLYLFDALENFCTNSICNFVSNNKNLYRDDDHISNYAAKFIYAPAMIKFFQEQKILN